MEELKEKLEIFLSKIDINSMLLLKIISFLITLNILIFAYNIYFNNSMYNLIKHKIDEDKVLVIDNNGNQYFKRIGYMTEETVMNFAIVSIRNLLEYTYDTSFHLVYAKKYVNRDIYNKLVQKTEQDAKQLELDEGYYKISFNNLKFIKIDEKNETWVLEAWIIKEYKGLGVEVEPKNELITLEIEYKSNLLSNPLGLIINKMKEKVMNADETNAYKENNK